MNEGIKKWNPKTHSCLLGGQDVKETEEVSRSIENPICSDSCYRKVA